jgi:hypothetical protein
MFIASRGLESQVVLAPAAPNASPSNPAPMSAEVPRVAHLDKAETDSHILELLKKYVATQIFEDYRWSLRRPFKRKISTGLPSASGTQTDQDSKR